MLTGHKVTCGETGRVGSFLAHTAAGELVCQDKAGRFLVVKQARRPRRHKDGLAVWIRIDDVDKPVAAVRIGATRFRCVDDKVWAGAVVDCSEAVVIGERIAAQAAGGV